MVEDAQGGAPWRRDKLARVHREQLQRWRDAMNLIGPGTVTEQLEDCRRALQVLDDLSLEGVVADLGSGAGLPGLVLAARHPELEVVLVESRSKRAAFLDNVVARSGATGVQVLNERVEDVASEAFDGVVARAFAPPEDVLWHADRLLIPGGWVVLFLQGHMEAPPAPTFHVERQHDYEIEGKQRRSVRLRKSIR